MKTIAGLVLALVLMPAPTTTQSSPRNLRLRVQEAGDSLTGDVRWVQPQNRGTPELTGYDWEIRNGQTVLRSGSVTASVRAVLFAVPFPCGVTMAVNARVRATNPAWTQGPGPWGVSATENRTRVCATVPADAPEVTVSVDTVVVPPPTPVPPSQVTDLAHIGNHVLQWTQVPDGAGGAADYALRHGCPTLQWGSAFPTEEVVPGTAVGQALEHTATPTTPPCQYRLVSFRGTLGVDAVFGQISNAATVPALVSEPTALRSGWDLYTRSPPRFSWDSARFNIGEQTRLCWYAQGADTTQVFGKWPAECPDVYGLSGIAAYADSMWIVRCRESGGTWTAAVSAPFTLNCGGVARWTANGVDFVEGTRGGNLGFEVRLNTTGGAP